MAEIHMPHFGPFVTRKIAVDLGIKQYLTGMACANGHYCTRFTANYKCKICLYKKRESKKDKYNDARKLDRLVNKERYRIRRQEWRDKNPEKHAAIKKCGEALRRSRIKNNGGRFNWRDVFSIGESQNWECVNCGKKIRDSYQVDHIMPIYLGGTNWPSNLQLLCASCNQSKKNMHPSIWDWKNGRRFCDYFARLPEGSKFRRSHIPRGT